MPQTQKMSKHVMLYRIIRTNPNAVYFLKIQGEFFMLPETIAVIITNFTYLFLKVSSNGEFPSPLSSAKEKEHFLKYKNGDLQSRNILIERNLRLVAHIVKA